MQEGNLEAAEAAATLGKPSATLTNLDFKFGEHTGSHGEMTKLSKLEKHARLEVIEQRCEEHGVLSLLPLYAPAGTTAWQCWWLWRKGGRL